MAEVDENMKRIFVKGNQYNVLFTFDSDETNKSYIVYTDNAKDENGNTIAYASTYVQEEENISLHPIETDKEWRTIDGILQGISQTVQEKQIERDKKDEEINLWISQMEKELDSMEEKTENDLLLCISKIIDKLMDINLIDYIDPLFWLLKKAQRKAKINDRTNIDIGVKAYQQKNYQLAELIFTHTDAKEAQNNLAYMIRRGEVKEPSEYNKRIIAETLKEGVHEQEPFYMINMSLFWALNIGGEVAWKLADSIMSTIPNKDIHSEVEWWLNVGQTGDVEGYLVHYWLLKYDKISSSPLGTKKDIRKYISQSIKKMPDYI